MKNCRFLVILVALCTLCLPQSLYGQGSTQVILETGDPAIANGIFQGFGGAVLNDASDISFLGFLTDTNQGNADDQAIFLWSDTGTLQELARTSNPMFGGNGTIVSLGQSALANDGSVLYAAIATGSSGGFSDDSGLILFAGGLNNVIAREGSSTYDANGDFGHFSFSNIALSPDGDFAFYNATQNSTGGSTDDLAIFQQYSTVVREGDANHDSTGNITTISSRFGANDSGQTVFYGIVDGTENTVYRKEFDGSLTPVFVEGDSVPGGNGEFNFATGALRINKNGWVALEASLANTAAGSSDNEVILRGNGSSQLQIAREGQSTPNGDGQFSTFYSESVQLNDMGDVCFSATLRNTPQGTSDDTGIYVSNGYSIAEIVREGQPAPDLDGSFNPLGFSILSLQERGAVYFRATLRGTANSEGIFAGDGNTLLTVARDGQLIDGMPITSLSLSSGESTKNGINAFGQCAFRATVSNGDQKLVLWTPDLHYLRTYSSDWDVISNWTLGIKPDRVHDVYISPPNNINIDGPSETASVRNLTIGGGNGIAEFELEQGGVLNVSNFVDVLDTGVITGDGVIAGDVSNSGEIKADNVTIAGDLYNAGLITGTGRVVSNIINQTTGSVRASDGQQLQLDGIGFTNQGLVDVVDGSLEVDGPATNRQGTGLIFASDAFLRFNSGLENLGGIGVTVGSTFVYGDIDNTGVINVSGGAIATFVDDLDQNGVLQVVSVGNTNSSAVLFGAFTGAGGFTGGGDVFALGDLRPGNSPASVLMDGNLFLGSQTETQIEIGGTAINEFDQLVVTGDLSLTGTLEVSFLDGFSPDPGDEFIVVEVQGERTGQFVGVENGDLIEGTGLFINYYAGDGNDIALTTIDPTETLSPESLAITRGVLSAGGLDEIQASDNADVSVRRNVADLQSRTEYEFTTISPSANPTSMSLTMEASTFSRSTLQQSVRLFNYDIADWEVVDSRNSRRFQDRVDTIEVEGDLSRFIEPGTQTIKARVLFRSVSPRQQFTSNMDQFFWSLLR